MTAQKRTQAQLRNHFEVESGLAKKLMAAPTREARSAIYATMYDELFAKVPDHPRLTGRTSPESIEKRNRGKLAIVQKLVDKETVFGEFAPGDCHFCYSLASKVKSVIGIDISDQRGDEERAESPDNFSYLLYDGYSLDNLDDKIDVFFSDQLIEHIHPEECQNHFDLVQNALVAGGKYIMRIPHRLSGPHDISKHFTKEPTGFHINEPLYKELVPMIKKAGFSRVKTYYSVKEKLVELPYAYFYLVENTLSLLPYFIRKKLSKLMIPKVVIAAIK